MRQFRLALVPELFVLRDLLFSERRAGNGIGGRRPEFVTEPMRLLIEAFEVITETRMEIIDRVFLREPGQDALKRDFLDALGAAHIDESGESFRMPFLLLGVITREVKELGVEEDVILSAIMSAQAGLGEQELARIIAQHDSARGETLREH